MQVRPPRPQHPRMQLYERQLTRSRDAVVHGYDARMEPHNGIIGLELNEQRTGDTKAGAVVGKDLYGNTYYENLEDLPCMTGPDPEQWIWKDEG